MTLAFIKQINEYVIDATLEASEKEILASVSSKGYPTQQDIYRARAAITQAVKEQRQNRLSQEKASFQAYKHEQQSTQESPLNRSIPEMLSDIVAAMHNTDKVPKGIILAFREQGQGGSESDIVQIWQDLVELGLIDPNNSDR